MKATLRLAFAASALLPTFSVAAAEWNWADDQQQITQGPEYTASKAICRRLRDLKPPASDRPDPSTAAALGPTCNAEALYYDIGVPSDPVRARQCAFVERDAASASPYSDAAFGGTAMLMTIYANGVGAVRDLDLATALACRVNGAPAEVDGRVKHLQKLKAEHWSGHNFSFCDDATSGYSGSVCAAHDAAIANVQRSDRLARLTNAWPPADKTAFAKLRAAEQAYMKASGSNEVDLSGTMRGALVIDHEQQLEDDFVGMLAALEMGQVPTASASDFNTTDAELNAAYRRVMAAKDPVSGTVTRDGIRTAQRAWLSYRDAWVVFVKIKYPSVSSDSIRTWLTQKRIAELKAFPN
jgi:uncharacterized protein YecT (DUF1311 family)